MPRPAPGQPPLPNEGHVEPDRRRRPAHYGADGEIRRLRQRSDAWFGRVESGPNLRQAGFLRRRITNDNARAPVLYRPLE